MTYTLSYTCRLAGQPEGSAYEQPPWLQEALHATNLSPPTVTMLTELEKYLEERKISGQLKVTIPDKEPVERLAAPKLPNAPVDCSNEATMTPEKIGSKRPRADIESGYSLVTNLAAFEALSHATPQESTCADGSSAGPAAKKPRREASLNTGAPTPISSSSSSQPKLSNSKSP